METRRPTIPVFLLVKTAIQLLWQQRDDALRLGLVPTLLMFGGFLYGRDGLVAIAVAARSGIPAELPPGVTAPVLVLAAIVLIALCLVTVNWLRFLLLGPMGAVGIGLAIGLPHLRFLITAIGFFLAMLAAAFILSVPLAFLPPALAVIGNLVLLAVVFVLLARFLPYLIGKAIGQSMSLAQSWRVSRGNGVPLAIGLILVQVPFMLGYTILDALLNAIGFATQAPMGMIFILSVLQSAVSICQAGVMATAYRHMVGVRV